MSALIVKLELIDETEAKVSVLRHTYRNTSSLNEFLEQIEANTHIPLAEARLAWEIFDHLAWEDLGNEA